MSYRSLTGDYRINEKAVDNKLTTCCTLILVIHRSACGKLREAYQKGNFTRVSFDVMRSGVCNNP